MSQIWLPKYLRSKAPAESKTFVYFENAHGQIAIPPRIDIPTPAGYVRHEVSRAHEVEAVSKRYAAQKQTMFERLDEATAKRVEAKMAEVRGNLNVIMARTKSQFEKDFIRRALQRLDDDEHKLKTRKYEMHLDIESKEAPLT